MSRTPFAQLDHNTSYSLNLRTPKEPLQAMSSKTHPLKEDEHLQPYLLWATGPESRLPRHGEEGMDGSILASECSSPRRPDRRDREAEVTPSLSMMLTGHRASPESELSGSSLGSEVLTVHMGRADAGDAEDAEDAEDLYSCLPAGGGVDENARPGGPRDADPRPVRPRAPRATGAGADPAGARAGVRRADAAAQRRAPLALGPQGRPQRVQRADAAAAPARRGRVQAAGRRARARRRARRGVEQRAAALRGGAQGGGGPRRATAAARRRRRTR